MADNNTGSACGGGISLAGIIAAILSWCTWHSVGWAILHFIFGGFYIIYWLIEYYGTVTLKW